MRRSLFLVLPLADLFVLIATSPAHGTCANRAKAIENCPSGTAASTWDISGAGDASPGFRYADQRQ